LKLLIFPFFAGMNIREAGNYFIEQCSSLYDKSESEEIFFRVAEHLTSKTKAELTLNKKLSVDKDRLDPIILELKTNKPIQYILGYEWFYNCKIAVNEQVLIPRPETEELVRWILQILKIQEMTTPEILDIGTGSGCIPVILKKEYKQANMTAIDISEGALQVAMKNSSQYKLDIQFLKMDILKPEFPTGKIFDIIVSNPPYITQAEKNEMHERVLSFEPTEALFVTNDDPLQFYKAILFFAEKHLATEGMVFLELNSLYGQDVEQLFDQAGFETDLRKDMYGNTRMLMATKKKPADLFQQASK